MLRGLEHAAYQQTMTADIMKRDAERDAAAALDMDVLQDMTYDVVGLIQDGRGFFGLLGNEVTKALRTNSDTM